MDVKARFEAALASFTDKIKNDPNVLAVVVYGSFANDMVWEKSDIDVTVLVRDMKLKTTEFCVDEDGLILNVGVYKEFDFKRWLEGGLGGGFSHSLYYHAKVVYASDASLKEFIENNRKLGADDRALSFFQYSTYLLGDTEKIEKWLTVKDDPLYAQFWVLKAADTYANMRLLLDGKPISREAVLKVANTEPESIRPVYEKPMQGYMSREEIQETLTFFRAFLKDNTELIKQSVKDYMADGEVRTVTNLTKHFRLDSHCISHVFDFLAEEGIVARVTEPVKITPKSRRAVEEVAFMYIAEIPMGQREAAPHDAPHNSSSFGHSQGREFQW